jgi:SAM-dependent methyltransferase
MSDGPSCGRAEPTVTPGFKLGHSAIDFLRKTGAARLLAKFRPLVLLSQKYAGTLFRPYLVSKYFRANEIRKLQIGSDVWLLPGWLNTDLSPQSFGCVALDATKRFPFDAGSFDYVFSEHQMEHINYKDAANMLRECHRVLRPGGKIRIALPSMDRLLELAAPPRTAQKEKYILERTALCYPTAYAPNPCFAINATFLNWGHRFLYDRQTLGHLLELTGYTNIQFLRPGESDDVNLAGLEKRVSETDIYDTMVAQAIRV